MRRRSPTASRACATKAGSPATSTHCRWSRASSNNAALMPNWKLAPSRSTSPSFARSAAVTPSNFFKTSFHTGDFIMADDLRFEPVDAVPYEQAVAEQDAQEEAQKNDETAKDAKLKKRKKIALLTAAAIIAKVALGFGIHYALV